MRLKMANRFDRELHSAAAVCAIILYRPPGGRPPQAIDSQIKVQRGGGGGDHSPTV